MLQYQFPDEYRPWIEKNLKDLGFSLDNPKKLAQAVKATSEHYISKDKRVTDWRNKDKIAAYLSYYFPLNYVRTLKIIDEIKQTQFSQGLQQVVDFGCGPGTTIKALVDQGLSFQRIRGIDTFQSLEKYFSYTLEPTARPQFQTQPAPPTGSFLLCLSYVLNELDKIPAWFFTAEALLIVEPSSHKESQSLQKFRGQLIEQGYHIWGPCLHQQPCPLLNHKKDWCHNRAYWQQPPWFAKIDQQLPIKNESLAFSYLLAHKKPAPQRQGLRIIGDARVEKGKTKWQFCHPEERQFLSCLHRKKKPPEIYRGDIVNITKLDKKVNEWRFQAEDFKQTSFGAKSSSDPASFEKDPQ